MVVSRIRRVHVILVLIVGAVCYLFLSPCASNNARIINGTGQSIDVVMRVRNVVVWAGEIGSSDIHNVAYLHPGGEGSIDIRVTLTETGSDLRGEFGYVWPYDGQKQIFLVNHRGIHHATIHVHSYWDLTLFIVENTFGPWAAKIACAGPDWL